MEVFPKDIILEIISRMPLKSIGPFMCASKTWYNLISTPHFTKLHLNRTITDHTHTHTHTHKLLMNISSFSIQTMTSSCRIASIDAESPNPTPDFSRVGFDFLLFNNSHRIEVIGCRNGIVSMFVNSVNIFLVNPLTREFKRLPEHEPKLQFYGFGQNPVGDDDYNVVLGSIVLQVCSMRRNVWREVHLVLPHHILTPIGVFANGALHWTAERKGQKWSCHIVAFDLGEQRMKVVPRPNDGYKGCLFTLGVLGGSLVFIRDYSGKVWKMEVYGVGECWTVLLHLPPMEEPEFEFLLTPQCYKKNGDVIMQNCQHIITYKKEENCFSLSPLTGSEDRSHVVKRSLHWYFESLFSPLSENERNRLHWA